MTLNIFTIKRYSMINLLKEVKVSFFFRTEDACVYVLHWSNLPSEPSPLSSTKQATISS
jgi:hypothetical protein